jgi:xylulokinase
LDEHLITGSSFSSFLISKDRSEIVKEVIDTSGQYLLGIDLGTMVVKSAIFDLKGNNLGMGHGEYPIESPHPSWAEHDQRLWWSEIKRTVNQALSQAKIDPKDIVGIGCCGQSHATNLISKDGKVLMKSIIWPDRRAVKQEKWVRENVGERESNQTLTAVKLLWIKENLPEIWKQTYKILLPHNFVVWKLTDEFSSEPLDAATTAMFDFEKNDWSDRLLEAYGIERKLLPEIRKSTEIVGEVTEKAADETGLAKGTPVVAGSSDGAAQIYGAGLVKPGRGLDRTGTVGVLMVAVERPKDYIGYPNIIQGIMSVSAGWTQTAGASLRWFRDQFCDVEKLIAAKSGVNEYQLMDREVDQVEPGSGGVIFNPYLLGRSGPMNKHGFFFGITIHTTREQMMRAVMEGYAFELRRGIDRWKSQGVECDEIWTCGGAAESRTWRQIRADILGLTYCKTNIKESGNWGVAVLAGYGVGVYKDLVTPIEETVKVVERNEPREEYKQRYDELFNLYDELNTLLEESGIYDKHVKGLENGGILEKI